MSCIFCKKIENSCKKTPFISPGSYRIIGEKNFYQCPRCAQRWYCYNDHLCLWGKVDDNFTWKLIVNNIDSVPIAIGGTCIAMKNGYEAFDIDPVHKPCEEKIFNPELKTILTGKKRMKTLAIQWFGDFKPFNLFQYQFQFPIPINRSDYLEIIDFIKIVFIGEIGSFPDRDQRKSLLGHFGPDNQDKIVIYLMSPKITKNMEEAGHSKPLSFVTEIVLLGDPNVGVIKPQRFYDPDTINWIVEEST